MASGSARLKVSLHLQGAGVLSGRLLSAHMMRAKAAAVLAQPFPSLPSRAPLTPLSPCGQTSKALPLLKLTHPNNKQVPTLPLPRHTGANAQLTSYQLPDAVVFACVGMQQLALQPWLPINSCQPTMHFRQACDDTLAWQGSQAPR